MSKCERTASDEAAPLRWTPRALVRRQCCPTGNYEFIEPPVVERSMAYRYVGGEPPVLGEIDEPPLSERTAWHEAGHAVLGHAFGIVIEKVTILAPAHVAFVSAAGLTAMQSIAKSYAGPVGEMAYSRCWITIPVGEEEDFLARVAAFRFGGCDECRMAMIAWSAVGLDAGVEAARAVFRDGQLLALRLGQERRIQQAIKALAAALMERPTCSGKRAASIIEPFIKFGEFKNAEKA